MWWNLTFTFSGEDSDSRPWSLAWPNLWVMDMGYIYGVRLSGVRAKHYLHTAFFPQRILHREGEEGTDREQADILIKAPTNFLCSFKMSPQYFPLDIWGYMESYSVPSSAIRHWSCPDYTSDAAIVHSKTSAVNYWAAQRRRLHLQGRSAMYLITGFDRWFKVM